MLVMHIREKPLPLLSSPVKLSDSFSIFFKPPCLLWSWSGESFHLSRREVHRNPSVYLQVLFLTEETKKESCPFVSLLNCDGKKGNRWCIFLRHPNAKAMVFFFFFYFSFFHSLSFYLLFLVVQWNFPLYWQRADIKEYWFTYTVLIKCTKIPPKDIINVLFLL